MTKNRDKSLSGDQDREGWECCQITAKRIYKQPGSQMQRRHRTPDIWMQITSNKRKLGERDGPEERLRSPGTPHMDKNSSRQEQKTGGRYMIQQQKHISYLMSICWFKHTTAQRSTQATTPEWWPLDYLGSQEPNSSEKNGTGHWHGNLRTVGQRRSDSEWLVLNLVIILQS